MTDAAPARPVAGIVLAAGSSRRMPGPGKLLRAWGGTSVVGAVIGTATAAGLAPVLVVTGHDADAVLRASGRDDVLFVHHRGWARGRAGSLGAGLARLAPLREVGAAVVLLGDEPEVSTGAVARVVAEWRERGTVLVRVRYRDRPGHPVLLDRRTWEAARALHGDAGTWERLVAAGIRSVELAVDSPAPIDVDGPADLAAARARHLGAGPETGS
jgi:molybdenum cofactor cytidylyltransferase